MGKKEKPQKGGRKENSESEDEGIIEETIKTGAVKDPSEFLELIREKSVKTRETAWAHLLEAMRTSVCEEFVSKNIVGLTSFIQTALKKGSSVEVKYACLVACLIACVLGEDSTFWKSISGDLLVVVETSTDAVLLSSTIMETFEKVFRNSRSVPVMEPVNEFEPIPYALVNWALLAVTAEPRQKVKENIRKQIPYLVLLLEHPSVSVRMAAAQTVAILYTLEMHWSEAKDESFDLESWSEIEGVSTSQLSELTDNLKLKHPNRADHSLQKDLMKSVHYLLVDGEEPVEKIVVFKKKMEVTGFVTLSLLQMCRNVLGSSLPLYCLSCGVVQDLLDLHVDPDQMNADDATVEDGLGRKAALESRRKAREKGIDEGRKHREHDKNHSISYAAADDD